ncbi:hypothetical protein GYA93_17450 [Gordonia desulfuricans]|uniref:Phospholipase n=1 Tax=Gordonia desulfuricans TaxID=89051 RepID=A0A7K3LTL1_9ACTN|nr:hypothetical protein [Gordonia desulfuricans]NDK91351.1 hypothetical protein [Gordonia desulfuricans]
MSTTAEYATIQSPTVDLGNTGFPKVFTLRNGLRPTAWVVLGILVVITHAWLAVPAGARSPGSPTPTAHADEVSPAARTVQVLTGPDPAATLDALPADFVAVMGYLPVTADGYPTDPGGDCSSPVPMPDRFEPLCRTHDFGYDLLRYAERTGHPLGGWARLAIDAMLVARMHAECDGLFCAMAAESARIGLGVNTWRQYDGPPAPAEDAGDITATMLVRVTTAVTGRSAVA